jgi:hypothetical protein
MNEVYSGESNLKQRGGWKEEKGGQRRIDQGFWVVTMFRVGMETSPRASDHIAPGPPAATPSYSSRSNDPKPGLSTDELRMISLSSIWMESEHEGEQGTSRLSCGGVG